MANPSSVIETEKIFDITEDKFTDLALEIFNEQRKKCAVYREWCALTLAGKADPICLQDIPFLPVSFFKSHKVIADNMETGLLFKSSTTSGQAPSVHYVADARLYQRSFNSGFTHFYGDIQDYCFLALLPSYLERGDSSLVYMVSHFIEKGLPGSGFYLDEFGLLKKQILENEESGIKTLLIGVTYALLDFSDYLQDTGGPMDLKHSIIMETGGMKGRRKELPKPAVHEVLRNKFAVDNIHSEYGMTELLSQAYSQKENQFFCSKTMKILIQDPSDPGIFLKKGRRGRICIIDLANLHSCSFIASDDLGIENADGSFQVIGRIDFSDTRGCNLLLG